MTQIKTQVLKNGRLESQPEIVGSNRRLVFSSSPFSCWPLPFMFFALSGTPLSIPFFSVAPSFYQSLSLPFSEISFSSCLKVQKGHRPRSYNQMSRKPLKVSISKVPESMGFASQASSHVFEYQEISLFTQLVKSVSFPASPLNTLGNLPVALSKQAPKSSHFFLSPILSVQILSLLFYC